MKGGGGDRRSPPKLRGGGGIGGLAALGRNSRPASGGSSSSKDGECSMLGGNMAAEVQQAGNTMGRENRSSEAVMQTVEHGMAGKGEGRKISMVAGVNELGGQELGRKARFLHGENSAMEEEEGLHGAVHVDGRVGDNMQEHLFSNNDSMLLEDKLEATKGNREDVSVEEVPTAINYEQPCNEQMQVDARHNRVPGSGFGNSYSTQDARRNASLEKQGQFYHTKTQEMDTGNRNLGSNVWSRPTVVPLPARSELGDFISAKKIVQLDETVLESNIKRFEAALVGRLFGRKIPFAYLNSELKRRWDGFGQFRLMTTSADSFVCFFDNVDIRDAVLMGGPWTIAGQVLGLDRWSPSFSPTSEDGFITPVWVRLPGLPLYCWDVGSIARITGFLGEPLWIDAATDRMERGAFARACVKINLAEPLEPGVWVQSSRGCFFQPAVYEGLSTFCFKCGYVGHKSISCTYGGLKKTDAVQLQPTVGATNEQSAEQPSELAIPNEVEETLASLGEDTASGNTTQQQGIGPWMVVTRRKRLPPKEHGSARGGVFSAKPIQGGRQAGSGKAGAWRNSTNATTRVNDPNNTPAKTSQDNIWQSRDMGWSPPKTPWWPADKRSSSPNAELKSQDAVNESVDTEFPGFNFGATSHERIKRTSGNKDRLSKAHIERMKSHLGPLAYGSRKKRKQPPLNDGGDASPLVT